MQSYNKLETCLANIFEYEEAADIPEKFRYSEFCNGKVCLKSEVADADFEAIGLRYGDYLLFCDQVDEIADMLECPKRPLAANHVFVSPMLDGELADLGITDRPVTMTTKHVWMALQPGPWEGGEDHQHGIDISVFKRLPWLLEKPVLIANSKDDRTKLILVLTATDDRRIPLIASLKIDATGKLDLDYFMTNLISTVFGHDDFYDYFGYALKAKDVIYIDGEQEKCLTEMINREPFSNYSGLKRDCLLEPPQFIGNQELDRFPGFDSTWLESEVKKRFPEHGAR